MSAGRGKKQLRLLAGRNVVVLLREEIGLVSIEDDLKEDGLKWNLEEYKKNLPVIEKMYKERYERIKQ
jgi:GTP-dependent phosphoenolpyruvate carboxykinase